MRLPNADSAFVATEKLRGYALDPTHRVGQHKARRFASLLDLRVEDVHELRRLLLDAARTRDAELVGHDEHGHRYRIDFVVTWRGKQALLRSVWIVRPDEAFPRLVTCYPLAGGG